MNPCASMTSLQKLSDDGSRRKRETHLVAICSRVIHVQVKLGKIFERQK